MKFLGQVEAATFLREHPRQAETLRAWLGEIQHRNWHSPEALAADLHNVDTTSPPLAVFRLGRAALEIETLVDFRSGIVLLTGIREEAALASLV
jgi:mRNA-degrading endonuclease HigB of HigAB toxin-antitoxin module